ncbi:spermidine/putrescine ABC transporter substrate-binding protein [soil metagenome]
MNPLRTAIGALVAIALSGILAGCGKDDSPEPHASTTLNVLAWSEYIPQEVIDHYMDETQIQVTVDTVGSNEAMQAKLSAGAVKYDLIQPSEYFAEALVKTNRLAALEMANIPNFTNIMPEYKDQPFDPGNKFTVPYMSGVVGIVYNAEKIKTPIKGFKDVFKPEHAGRIIVVNDNREIVSWAMIVQGIPINEMTPENLSKVRPMLQQWVKLIKKYDSDSPKTDLQQGNADIGIVWNGEAALVIANDKRFKFVVPEEGTHRYIDNLAIPNDALHKHAAEQFIDFCLRPEISKSISDKWPYTNPNSKAREILSPEQLANPASYPALNNPETFRDIGKAGADVDKLMTEIRNGG